MNQEQAKRHLVTKAELIKDVLRITRETPAISTPWTWKLSWMLWPKPALHGWLPGMT